MRTIETWVTTSNTDLTEGKGREIVIARFPTQAIANAVVADKRYARYCCMGIQSKDDHRYMVRKDVLHICDSAEDFWENTIEERRKKALTKLTPADIEALGI